MPSEPIIVPATRSAGRCMLSVEPHDRQLLMRATVFECAADFRAWLERNHEFKTNKVA